MTLLLNFFKYVTPNLKFFHNLARSQRTNLEKRINYCKSNDDQSSNKDKEKEADYTKGKNEKKEYPEEPTACCMQGCANCVWLEYAEKLSEYYRDGGEQAIKEINERVTDENLKAFLLHELRMRMKNKNNKK